MDSSPLYHSVVTVYPLLIRRISALCDLNRLLNEYIFSGDNAHHEKYMITNSGSIENGQFSIYFTNQVSVESIYESMKGEACFSCSIPKKAFLTQPNKNQYIPQTMRKWQWRSKGSVDEDFEQYSFQNCYAIEHAIENKHDTVVLAISDEEESVSDIENEDKNINKKQQRKKRKSKSKGSNHSIDEAMANHILAWHLIIFNKEFEQKHKNVANMMKTNEIEIDSETMHQGIVGDIDYDQNRGYVHNKTWNAVHSFSIPQNIKADIKSNQLISYTLSIPKSFYMASANRTITAEDCVGNNVDIVSNAVLSRRKSRRRHSNEFADGNGFDFTEPMKISLFTPTHSSTETSPMQLIAPEKLPRRRKSHMQQKKICFSAKKAPKRRHSVSSHHHYQGGNDQKGMVLKSRFVVNPVGLIHDAEDIHDLLLKNYNNSSAPYRVMSNKQHNLQIINQSKHHKDRSRNVSREISLSITGSNGMKSHSPTYSLTASISPLSLTNHRREQSFNNLTPSIPKRPRRRNKNDSDQDVDDIILSDDDGPIENSESRLKSERLCIFDMTSWNGKEFKEFLRLIGESDYIKIFSENGIKANHLKIADEGMLRSMNIPMIHCKNIIQQRDYYLACYQKIKELETLNIKQENEQKLKKLGKDLKEMVNDLRIKRLQSQKLKCKLFAKKHHKIIQIIKQSVENIDIILTETQKLPKLNEGECKEFETDNGDSCEQPEKDVEDNDDVKEQNHFFSIRPEKELVIGCNKYSSTCIGCVCLQLMNINYVKHNFGKDSVDLVTTVIEKQLNEKINGLMSDFTNLSVFVYRNIHVCYYTLIVCKKNKNKKTNLYFEEFRSFLKDNLAAIGFKIPLYWKSKLNDKMSVDSEILKVHEQQRSISESKQLEGIVKSFDNLHIHPALMKQQSVSKSESISFLMPDEIEKLQKNRRQSLSAASMQSPIKGDREKAKKKKSPSKFKSLKKNLRRFSITAKSKNKKNKKQQRRLSELKDVDELKQYGLDYDADSFNLTNVNQIYFMLGSVYIDEAREEAVNLYTEIQTIRKMIHQNMGQRCNQNNKNEDEIIKCLSVDDFFVRRI